MSSFHVGIAELFQSTLSVRRATLDGQSVFFGTRHFNPRSP